MPTILFGVLMAYLVPSDVRVFAFFFLPGVVRAGLGWVLLAGGVGFLLATITVFQREGHSGKLVTRGTYAFCRHPIYASFVVFILPAVALLVNAWPLLGTSVVMYVAFKFRIGREYEDLRQAFGHVSEAYEARVNKILSFPHACANRHGASGPLR